MAGLLDPFLRGLGGQSTPPTQAQGAAGASGAKPKAENRRSEARRTPPLSIVWAEIDGPDATLYSGQLWDISRSGASISLGRNRFYVPRGTEVQLRLRSRNSPDLVTMAATVRWVDTNHGATFLGLHFLSPLESGTFLETFLDADGEVV